MFITFFTSLGLDFNLSLKALIVLIIKERDRF